MCLVADCRSVYSAKAVWLHAGKPEQWTSLFQLMLVTAHHQLDALYSGLQDTQEATAYR